MTNRAERGPRLPPRWFVRLAWAVHRGLYRVTGGRVGLWRPRGKRWGTLRLTTTGRRTGRKRSVIIAYLEVGRTSSEPARMAMSGRAMAEPASAADPSVVIRTRSEALVDGPRSRLWQDGAGRREARRLYGAHVVRDRGADGARSTRSRCPAAAQVVETAANCLWSHVQAARTTVRPQPWWRPRTGQRGPLATARPRYARQLATTAARRAAPPPPPRPRRQTARDHTG